MRQGLRAHMSTIVVAFVTASVAAGGIAAAGAIINADKVNGYRADQLIRMAERRKMTGGTESGTMAKVSITAPKKGYLYAVASSDVWVPATTRGGGITASCWIAIDDHAIRQSERVQNLTAAPEQDCATNVAWPVKAGTYQVSLDAALGGGVLYEETTLDVLFVPFDGTGDVPTPEDLPTDSPKASRNG
jgi:hypothetical protein